MIDVLYQWDSDIQEVLEYKPMLALPNVKLHERDLPIYANVRERDGQNLSIYLEVRERILSILSIYFDARGSSSHSSKCIAEKK